MSVIVNRQYCRAGSPPVEFPLQLEIKKRASSQNLFGVTPEFPAFRNAAARNEEPAAPRAITRGSDPRRC
jgi:hypothetical protein